MSFVDATCSGSTTDHILGRGRGFLEPQIDGVTSETKLVTITSGGNDVSYIGDMMRAVWRRKSWLARVMGGGTGSVAERDFARVSDNFERIVREIGRRAPGAMVLLVGYPILAPAIGTCKALGIDGREAEMARQVAAQLGSATRDAAQRTGAVFLDMEALSAGHDVCSAEPWVNGAAPDHGAAFHPNSAGAQAVADAILQALAAHPGRFVSPCL
jgi:lysophospholipase L1-like esterase